PGRYTLFTQFATPIKTGLAAGALPTTQKEHTLSLPFAIGSTQTAGAALQPDDRQAKWSNGYEYRVSGLPTQARPMGMIRVEVLKNGQPVQTI
ncbi:hypothetical protein ACE4Z6_26950, partial [Salmonella enterica]|uniref:hypothetical protein n=1 Tax=Salmonella enterica TaxID=28901 RepID=UPI003D283A7B